MYPITRGVVFNKQRVEWFYGGGGAHMKAEGFVVYCNFV